MLAFVQETTSCILICLLRQRLRRCTKSYQCLESPANHIIYHPTTLGWLHWR
jgi:hypothetical protein